MSRIRSVHPGLFSDPEFVQVTMAARMALIGLWTEADDHGVFEWKPLALKMRIFPGDAVDMAALMTELVSADRIRQVEIEGKAYGICRKFCTYQRPKNPSYRWTFSPAWAEFVGIKSSDSPSPPPVLPQPSGSATENVPQMEDGEGEKEDEEKKEEAAQARSPAKRGSRLSKDWLPSAGGCEFAKELGLNIETTLAKFIDHWTAETGAKATKLDWDAAWRTWCRKEPEFSRDRSPATKGQYQAPKSTADDAMLETYADLIAKRRHPGLSCTQIHVGKLVSAGRITREQAQAVGF